MAAIELLDSENADRNLTSQVTVLTDTPDASGARVCQAVIQLGDGSLNLDGTGGLFEIEVLVGGNTVNGGVEYQKVGTAVRTSLQSQQFLVPANAQVLIKLKSPNGADTNVDVTCYLYDVGPAAGVTRLASGTAQAGTASTIQLAASSAFADSELRWNVVNVTGGTGAGQSRFITAYTGATDTATVSPNWTTTPDSTSTYEIVQGAGLAHQVLTIDTQTELTAVPADDASLADMLGWLYLIARNKLTQTGTTLTVYADDGSTSVATASTSDDGVTFTRAEFT